MHSLTIELPEAVLIACGQSRDEFLRDAKSLLVLKLFEIGRLSSGKAAELCSMSRAEFLSAASRAGVPVAVLDEVDLADEFRDV
jgi:predicted HTH domain antitoxin